MNDLRHSMGFEMINENEIKISNEGFEYMGEVKTPPYHWGTLTNQIDPERRKSLKSIDIISKR